MVEELSEGSLRASWLGLGLNIYIYIYIYIDIPKPLNPPNP